MEEKLYGEQTETAAHAAEAEEIAGAEGGTVSYGKFKNADALYAAYNSLQAEFTKRCQRLKELENAAGADKESPAEPAESSEKRERDITDEEKEEILKGYLKAVLGRKTGAKIMDGAGAGLKTPESRPKTVEEAGELFRFTLGK